MPGVKIEQGNIIYDPHKLEHPGDLLHEAGHIAVMPPSERELLNGNVGMDDQNAMGNEIGAILWSYAAVQKIGLPANIVFHEHGYKGHSSWYLSNFESKKNYIGLPLLTWMGMAADTKKTAELGCQPFPNMLHWLRQ